MKEKSKPIVSFAQTTDHITRRFRVRRARSIHAFTPAHTRSCVLWLSARITVPRRSFMCLSHSSRAVPCRRVCSTLCFVWFVVFDRFSFHFYFQFCVISVYSLMLAVVMFCVVLRVGVLFHSIKTVLARGCATCRVSLRFFS